MRGAARDAKKSLEELLSRGDLGSGPEAGGQRAPPLLDPRPDECAGKAQPPLRPHCAPDLESSGRWALLLRIFVSLTVTDVQVNFPEAMLATERRLCPLEVGVAASSPGRSEEIARRAPEQGKHPSEPASAPERSEEVT